ncbi:MAG: hypothetical protein M1839_003194 [Geoglossum umbratile]|nr:MAG: hypothetical protein M1839_003194 [Geoglossum umbratile]
MHFTTVTLCTAVLLFVLETRALPTDLPSRGKRLQAKRPENEQYFLDEVIQPPEPGKCLFYTQGLSRAAQKYAKTHPNEFRTIWDIWPCNLYRGDNATTNPLRCIFDNEALRTLYFENMSRAMAMLCDVSATVMTKDVNHIPKGGIWGRVEDSTLKREDTPGGRVDEIIAIGPREGSLKRIWSRPLSSPIGKKPARESVVRKRCLEHQECYSADQLTEWFEDVEF